MMNLVRFLTLSLFPLFLSGCFIGAKGGGPVSQEDALRITKRTFEKATPQELEGFESADKASQLPFGKDRKLPSTIFQGSHEQKAPKVTVRRKPNFLGGWGAVFSLGIAKSNDYMTEKIADSFQGPSMYGIHSTGRLYALITWNTSWRHYERSSGTQVGEGRLISFVGPFGALGGIWSEARPIAPAPLPEGKPEQYFARRIWWGPLAIFGAGQVNSKRYIQVLWIPIQTGGE